MVGVVGFHDVYESAWSFGFSGDGFLVVDGLGPADDPVADLKPQFGRLEFVIGDKLTLPGLIAALAVQGRRDGQVPPVHLCQQGNSQQGEVGVRGADLNFQSPVQRQSGDFLCRLN